MKKSWMAALSLVAAVASGCAGSVDDESLPPGLTLSPVDATDAFTAGSGLPAASPDRTLAPTLVDATRDLADVAATPEAELTTCSVVSTAAPTMAQAHPLDRCARGVLAADATQHFVFRPELGVPYTLRLASAGDARVDLGVVRVGDDGQGRCAPIARDLTTIRLVETGPAEVLCAMVRSERGAAQSYRLVLAR